MVQIEAGRGRWSAFTDIAYLPTSATTQRNLVTIDADNKQTFVDVAAAYWPSGIDGRRVCTAGSATPHSMTSTVSFSPIPSCRCSGRALTTMARFSAYDADSLSAKDGPLRPRVDGSFGDSGELSCCAPTSPMRSAGGGTSFYSAINTRVQITRTAT